MPSLLVAGWVVVAVVLAPGCASRPIARPRPAALAAADAELLQGCYDCLLEARASYRRLAAGRERPRVVARVFEADLLIALREKELALPPSDALADARRIAAELPRDVEPGRYLALVDAIPSEPMGAARRDALAFRAAQQALVARLDAERAWLATGRLRAPVRDYLRLALDCAYPKPQDATQPVGSDAPAAPQPLASPLVWDARTGKPVTPPLEHQGPVIAAVFSADGTQVVTTTKDNISRVWTLSMDMGSLDDWRLLLRCSTLAYNHTALIANPAPLRVCPAIARSTAPR